MRLLSTSVSANDEPELCPEEFYGDKIPKYAMLSHTWGAARDEVQFADVQRATYQGKTSFAKVRGAIQQARKDGHPYIWIDSVCIDKSSSSELSEAINSMYRWYQSSEICYVYLADVSDTVVEGQSGFEATAFGQSRWWTRGWTLQELLAPHRLVFFSSFWTALGDRSALEKIITDRTNIETAYLQGGESLHNASVAKRMSWAASRTTTREEDMAYWHVYLYNSLLKSSLRRTTTRSPKASQEAGNESRVR